MEDLNSIQLTEFEVGSQEPLKFDGKIIPFTGGFMEINNNQIIFFFDGEKSLEKLVLRFDKSIFESSVKKLDVDFKYKLSNLMYSLNKVSLRESKDGAVEVSKDLERYSINCLDCDFLSSDSICSCNSSQFFDFKRTDKDYCYHFIPSDKYLKEIGPSKGEVPELRVERPGFKNSIS